MKSAHAFAIVLVTAPDLKAARALAKGALRQKLAACVNLVPKIESHYWWQGKLEAGAEVLLVFKTAKTLLPRLEKFIAQKHPYDTPEFLALPVTAGSERYLKWLSDNVNVIMTAQTANYAKNATGKEAEPGQAMSLCTGRLTQRAAGKMHQSPVR